MKHAKRWYVIADGGRARFVERDEAGAFRTILSFDASETHLASHELGTDRPPRTMQSATGTRHAIQPRQDLHEAAKDDFIKFVAAQLDAEHRQNHFDELVLAAPPKLIGELRHALSAAVGKIVINDLHKDLTKVPDHDLGSHLLATA